MEQKKSIGLGGRGWLLVIYVAIAMVAYQALTNYPLNVLADLYGGSAHVSAIYSACGIVGIIIQLLLGPVMGKMKSIKTFSICLGIVTIALGIGVAALPAGLGWDICYGLVNITSIMYATFACSILVGQWFPTRKGTIMGICTIAFPLANGLLAPFASAAFPANAAPAVWKAYLPFIIVFAIGWLVGLIFVTDFPEQCGAYRDNNKNMTPEVAKKMMEQEIEDRKTTVWRLPQILSTADFWLITLPMGLILMVSVAMMTQSSSIIASFDGNLNEVMPLVMIFGIIGSYVLGLIDTKIGTRKSMMIAEALMVIAGILGLVGGKVPTTIAIVFVALFMGSSSNYTVSGAIQYWRREDFPSVYSSVNPVANIVCNIGPVVFGVIIGQASAAGNLAEGVKKLFIIALVLGVLALVLTALFRPARIKAKDDRLREAAGKTLDDALVGRK